MEKRFAPPIKTEIFADLPMTASIQLALLRDTADAMEAETQFVMPNKIQTELNVRAQPSEQTARVWIVL